VKTHQIVGYGSLLSHASLKKTIPDRPVQPVIVRGYKRIFNVLANNHTDVLNIVKKSGGYFNGVLFTVNVEELKQIKQREQPQYQFRRSWAYDFDTGRKISLALLAIDLRHSLDHQNHEPNLLYLKSCREAAYAISKKFGQMWDDTTYTADSEKISRWIKKNKD